MLVLRFLNRRSRRLLKVIFPLIVSSLIVISIITFIYLALLTFIKMYSLNISLVIMPIVIVVVFEILALFVLIFLELFVFVELLELLVLLRWLFHARIIRILVARVLAATIKLLKWYLLLRRKRRRRRKIVNLIFQTRLLKLIDARMDESDVGILLWVETVVLVLMRSQREIN